MSKHEDLIGQFDFFNAAKVDPTERPEDQQLPAHMRKARILTYPCKAENKELKHSWPKYKTDLMEPFED